jgi:uncharacterized protein YndB with AHSA1/START domain
LEFRASRLIAVPPAHVFAFVADPANEPLWLRDDDDVVSAMVTEHVDGPPSGVGARYRRTNVFGPRTATTTFEVVRFEPGRLIEFEGEDEATTTFLVEPVEEGTCLSSVRAYRRGWARFTAALVPSGTQKTLEQDLARIERVMLSDRA